MSWWGARTAKKLESAPVAPAPPLDPVAEAHARMVAAKKVLDKLNADILAFRTAFNISTNFFDEIISSVGTMPVSKLEIDRQWRQLMQRKAKALHAFSDAVKIWSEAKGTAQ